MKIAVSEQPTCEAPEATIIFCLFSMANREMEAAGAKIDKGKKISLFGARRALLEYCWLTESNGQAKKLYTMIVNDSAPEWDAVVKHVKKQHGETARLCLEIVKRNTRVDPLDVAVASNKIKPDWLNVPEILIALGWSRPKLMTAISHKEFPAWKAVSAYRGAKKQWRLYFDVYEVLEWLKKQEESTSD